MISKKHGPSLTLKAPLSMEINEEDTEEVKRHDI
jgi:hypothetical protein